MYIKGAGTIPYRIYQEKSHLLAYRAIINALKDADCSINDIDAAVCSNLEWFYTGEMQRHFQSLLSSLLKKRIPIIRTPAACGGGGAALNSAVKLAQNEEDFNNVLVLGVDKLFGTTNNTKHVTNEFMMAAESKWEQQEGINFPASNALIAQSYLNTYPDATTDDLAIIAFKNHNNAFNNKNAFFYQKKVSLEKIKESPVVCSPLRLFDCSISTDGAAACVISKDKTDIKIKASELFTDYLSPFERKDLTSWEATKIAADNAFKKAGIERTEIDFAEIHDAFTIVELLSYEDMGFAKKGEGAKLIRDGTVCIDGKMPVNTSGGLKAKGHPVSATGVGQIYELVRQLRGESGERQINNPKIGLAQNIGGAGSTVTVNILEKV